MSVLAALGIAIPSIAMGLYQVIKKPNKTKSIKNYQEPEPATQQPPVTQPQQPQQPIQQQSMKPMPPPLPPSIHQLPSFQDSFQGTLSGKRFAPSHDERGLGNAPHRIDMVRKEKSENPKFPIRGMDNLEIKSPPNKAIRDLTTGKRDRRNVHLDLPEKLRMLWRQELCGKGDVSNIQESGNRHVSEPAK